MKKALQWGVIVFGMLLILAGCTASDQTSSKSGAPVSQSKPKPKPTEAGARAFEKKWIDLTKAKKYAELYELLSPDNKKLISKDAYIESHKKDDASGESFDYKVNIGTVEINKNTAKVIRSVTTPLGTYSDTDRIVFINGKWYQQLESKYLIELGVSPTKINGINEEALGQQFSIPAFSVVVDNVRIDKTATGEYGSRETAQGKFLMIDASITNTGKQPFRPERDENFQLVDGEGRSFKPSDSYSVFSPFGEIGPGLSEKKTIGFDVPETAKGFILVVGKGSDLRFVELGI